MLKRLMDIIGALVALILFLTVKKVVFREGISADDHVTMPFFEGLPANVSRFPQPVTRTRKEPKAEKI